MAVINSPVRCQVTYTTLSGATDPLNFDAIVGESERQEVVRTMPCLFTRQLSERMRQKYGLSDDYTAVVVLSVQILQQHFGQYRFSEKDLKISIHNKLYLVNRVVYQGETAFTSENVYAVEFRLKDLTQSG